MKISRGICRGEHGLGADLPGFKSGPCHLHAEGPGTSEFSSLWLCFLTWKMKLSLYPHLSPLSKSWPFFKVQFRCYPPPPPPMKPFPVFLSLVLCACSSCHLSLPHHGCKRIFVQQKGESMRTREGVLHSFASLLLSAHMS